MGRGAHERRRERPRSPRCAGLGQAADARAHQPRTATHARGRWVRGGWRPAREPEDPRRAATHPRSAGRCPRHRRVARGVGHLRARLARSVDPTRLRFHAGAKRHRHAAQAGPARAPRDPRCRLPPRPRGPSDPRKPGALGPAQKQPTRFAAGASPPEPPALPEVSPVFLVARSALVGRRDADPIRLSLHGS